MEALVLPYPKYNKIEFAILKLLCGKRNCLVPSDRVRVGTQAVLLDSLHALTETRNFVEALIHTVVRELLESSEPLLSHTETFCEEHRLTSTLL